MHSKSEAPNNEIPLMQPNQKYTIETIARNSGFGSRNSFYQNYRSAYGLTPSEFLKASSISGYIH
jgi:Transcriptional regulator containing an amidase domain and an AraC-type DNA-binding HTH domain